MLHSSANSSPASTSEHLDELPLRDAVLAEGLVLIQARNDEIRLYAVCAGWVDSLGSFTSSPDAWRVLDRLEEAS